MRQESFDNQNILAGIALATLLGGAAAYLFASDRGSQVRKQLSDNYEKWGEKGKDWKKRFSHSKEESFAEQFPAYCLVGVACGAIGVLTGLLLAPKSGEELRHDIMDKYEELSEKTQDFASHLGDKGHDIADAVSSHTSDWVEKAQDFLEQIGGKIHSASFENSGRGTFTSDKLNDVAKIAALGLHIWNTIRSR